MLREDKIEELKIELLSLRGVIERTVNDIEALSRESFEKHQILQKFVKDYQKLWETLLEENILNGNPDKHTGLYPMPIRIKIIREDQIIFEDGSTKF